MGLPILQERGGALSGLVQGIGQGLQQAMPSIQEMILNRQKQKQIQAILNPQGQQPPVDRDEMFRNLALSLEQQSGQDMQPKDLDVLWSEMQKNPQLGMPQQQQPGNQQYSKQQILAAEIAGEHNLANLLAKLNAGDQKEHIQDRKEAFARETAAEPKLQEMETKLGGLEQSGMRFKRLGELFSPDLENKFPSSLSVGLFTKDGELRPTAAALLSPEAQEAVKLVSDELSGAKDTFGARVTNFDLQSYMKRLPTLLNSAEGRRRVLRDLRIMNKINQLHHEGILNIVDKHGGAGKMPISKAERIFKNEYKDEMEELRDEFVNPNKKSFSSLRDPASYPGKRMIDEETGQIFKSNGQEWVPE